jgi:hypothetical protein
MGLPICKNAGIMVSMLKRSSKKSRGLNAEAIMDNAGEDAAEQNPPAKNSAAVELGRLGGLKGGKARAEALSAKKRSAIAQKAAEARWKKHGK